jgi:hypothetical protein
MCETWSLTLREADRLKVFENRVLRRIFGPNRDETIGGWGKLQNGKLHNLYSSPNVTRMMKSRRMKEKRNAYRGLVGKPGGKRPLGRPRRRWDYNIKMDLRERGWGAMDWIEWPQDREQWKALVNMIMNRVQ